MIGLDTSVVVRLLVGLPERQARTARVRLERAFNEGEKVLVCDLVAAEAYFALHYHYGVPKAEARRILFAFLTSGVVQPDPADLERAFAGAPGAGPVDRLIHGRYRTLGAQMLTFERKLPGEGVVRL